MATLHSGRTIRPHHSHRSQTTPTPHCASGWHVPSHSVHGDKDDIPWHHMAHTYTWVVENEYNTLGKSGRKTEQWILQQQMFLEAEGTSRHPRVRDHARQKVWDEMVYSYEIEAERWMRHEEARRRAAEKERRARLIDEEIRRIETRMRVKREDERRKMNEEKQRIQNELRERERRSRLKAEKTMLEAWHGYDEGWKKIASSCDYLTFSSIPWPLVVAPAKAEEITPRAVMSFLFSPVHSEKQTRKERLRSAQLRWHPDRFERVLARVKDEDKAEVQQGVGIVARCLNDIKL